MSFRKMRCLFAYLYYIAFRTAEHLANTLAEYWVNSPMKSTASSLFTREETTQRGASR